ncbi:MAG: ATP-binding protein [Alphaproteobacteria bacterium]
MLTGWTIRLKRLVPSGLLGRSLLIMVMPLILLQVVSAFVFYERHWTTVARQLAQGLAADITAVVEARRTFADADDDAGRTWFVDLAGALDLKVTMDEGGILHVIGADLGDDLATDTLAQALRDRVAQPFSIDTTPQRDVRVSIQMVDGVLRFEASRKRLFTSTTYIFVLWMVGSSLVLFGVATLFMRNQVRPIRRLAAVTHGFGKGRDVPSFKPEGAAEVRQAGQAFNLMRERIRRQIDQRTEMLAGVSHDLRTPLTRMKLQLAMAGALEGVEELTEDVAEMERMVEGYLAFARGEGTEAIRPASLMRIVEDVVGRFRRNGGRIDLHVERDVVVPVRPDAVGRCLGNLIGNAIRYAEHVAVRAGQRGDVVEIIIDDDGPGIPAEKREEVFKAFYRVEGSRNPATGGVGLGLTIARDLARSHGGEILLEDSPMGGLRARVRLPL